MKLWIIYFDFFVIFPKFHYEIYLNRFKHILVNILFQNFWLSWLDYHALNCVPDKTHMLWMVTLKVIVFIDVAFG